MPSEWRGPAGFATGVCSGDAALGDDSEADTDGETLFSTSLPDSGFSPFCGGIVLASDYF